MLKRSSAPLGTESAFETVLNGEVVPTGVCRSSGVDLGQTGGEQLAAALKAASLRKAWIWQVMIGTEREDGTFEQHPIAPKDGTECAVWRIGFIDQLSRTSLLADMAAAAGGKCDEDPAA